MNLDESLASAIELAAKGQYGDAWKLLDGLRAAHPDEPEVHIAAGSVSWEEGRLEEATEAFHRATELAPDSETASLGHFRCLWKQDERIAARSEANRFLSGTESPVYRELLHKLDGKNFNFVEPSVAAWRRWLDVILLSVYPALALPIWFLYVPSFPDGALLVAPACLLWAVSVAYAQTGSAKAARHAVVLGCLVSAWHGFNGFAMFASGFGMGGGAVAAYALIGPLLLGFFLTVAATVGIAWSQFVPR